MGKVTFLFHNGLKDMKVKSVVLKYRDEVTEFLNRLMAETKRQIHEILLSITYNAEIGQYIVFYLE